MATPPTKWMTFAEFELLPEPKGARLELRHGEPTPVPPPKNPHFLAQQRLRDLLSALAASNGCAVTEVGFRPRSENEFRIADVAYFSPSAWQKFQTSAYFEGAPDLVIEILSPSNTATEMLEKEALCLENGAREFWLVDLDRRQVRVSTPDGRSVTYKSTQQIPLFFGGSLSVDAVFTAS